MDLTRVAETFLGALLAFAVGALLQRRLLDRQERFQKEMAETQRSTDVAAEEKQRAHDKEIAETHRKTLIQISKRTDRQQATPRDND